MGKRLKRPNVIATSVLLFSQITTTLTGYKQNAVRKILPYTLLVYTRCPSCKIMCFAEKHILATKPNLGLPHVVPCFL